jgi:hypothetical protein
MDNALFGFGAVCIVAAIIGGGLKALQVEMPVIQSRKRQGLLAVFGVVLMLLALIPTGAADSEASNNRNTSLVAAPIDSSTRIGTKKPTVIGIYPVEDYGVPQRGALELVEQKFTAEIEVVHLQATIRDMKQGKIDTLLTELRTLLTTGNALAVVGPSVTETVNPVLDVVNSVTPAVPVFLLSAISAQAYGHEVRMQPIFRLSAGIDARAKEFARFVNEAVNQGVNVKLLVERKSAPTDPQTYGEQLRDRVVEEIGQSAWSEYVNRGVVTIIPFAHDSVAYAFPALERIVGADEVIILFGSGGDMARIVRKFYSHQPGREAPAARIVGWMNAWALHDLGRDYYWPLIVEITDAYFPPTGDLPGEAGRYFLAKYGTRAPQVRDEIYAFDSALAPVEAFLDLTKQIGDPGQGQYLQFTPRLRQQLLELIQERSFDLASGKVHLASRSSAGPRLVYTRFSPTDRVWEPVAIGTILHASTDNSTTGRQQP